VAGIEVRSDEAFYESSGLATAQWLMIQNIGSQIAEGMISFRSIEKISNVSIAKSTNRNTSSVWGWLANRA
jgi:hypothetical protein